ncbi:MAG: hypothetical protein ACI81S_002124 [Sphingobacteriales bacterium]
MKVRTSPYSKSYPIFKITSKENKEVLSSNPYHFSAKAYDGKTKSIKLLGFTDYQGNYTIIHDTICKGDQYTFPNDSVVSNIQNPLTFVSELLSISGDLDRLAAKQIFVKKVNTKITKSGRTLISDANATNYLWLDCDNGFAAIEGATSNTFTST